MSVNRDKSAKERYLSAGRADRKTMTLDALCDTGRDIGLLRRYMVRDFDHLVIIRKRKAYSRGEKMTRKAEYITVLAKMANRLDRMPTFKDIGI